MPNYNFRNNETGEDAFLDINSLHFLEQMYETYITDPQNLDEKWTKVFKKFSDQIPSDSFLSKINFSIKIARPRINVIILKKITGKECIPHP